MLLRDSNVRCVDGWAPQYSADHIVLEGSKADMEYEKELKAEQTTIDGLLLVDLAVHGDNRGWFKENWQREKMTALGIPDCKWIQNNISYNESRGATRGIHAEPWDKFISIAAGSVFGAWVDLRADSKTFGCVFTCTLDPAKAIFVPRGVANSYQALEDGTTYTYLVNAHWAADLKSTYTFVNLADPALAIPWPIPLDQAEISEADKQHPYLKDVIPMQPKRTLVTGCNGQLGKAVRAYAEQQGLTQTFDFCGTDTFDIADSAAYARMNWSKYGTVINCAAYTAVDQAETEQGRIAAWKANATGPALLARVCAGHDITLVHVSSDYVFDGTQELHTEDEQRSPLGVYGQSKAAGDVAVSTCPKHYIVRSSWVIGDGHNFVKTMAALSKRCADPEDALNNVTVVNDQFGRLTFTSDMVRGIFHLLNAGVPYGTYNLTASGEVSSWFDVAKEVFALTCDNAPAVQPVSTQQYREGAKGSISLRPMYSTLDLSKTCSAGFEPADWKETLKAYLNDKGVD